MKLTICMWALGCLYPYIHYFISNEYGAVVVHIRYHINSLTVFFVFGEKLHICCMFVCSHHCWCHYSPRWTLTVLCVFTLFWIFFPLLYAVLCVTRELKSFMAYIENCFSWLWLCHDIHYYFENIESTHIRQQQHQWWKKNPLKNAWSVGVNCKCWNSQPAEVKHSHRHFHV